jgi:hydrogenase maturation protease
VNVLVAGVGNIFFGDDGFGVEVAKRLAGRELPEGTTVVDYGIRGMHLALDLLSPPDLLVLVDAASRSGPPGTIYIIEPEDDVPVRAPDAHSIDPNGVFQALRAMGGTVPRARIVGCEPADLSETIGLSEPVEQAIEPAITMICRLVESEVRGHAYAKKK